MNSKLLFVPLFFLYSLLPAQSVKKILFIGNSYTYVNDLPLLVHDIALSFGDSISYDSNTPGGYTLQQHSSDPLTLSKISSQSWDFVVLQAQSQEPSFDPVQVQAQTFPYAAVLNDSVKANNPCTETVFYMTWGRQNGDASNCGAYPPVCTFDGMQSRLRESYLQMADSNAATCAPAGMAWKYARIQYPAINLYQSDESHPSPEGSYLTACVFYATLFGKTPVGSSFISTLNAGDALALQNIAATTVFDSLSLWRIKANYPKPSFTVSPVSQLSYQFNNTSLNAVSYLWDFGDGNYSAAVSPTHAFSGNGIYTVKLGASNSCFTDTTEMIVNTNFNGIPEKLKEISLNYNSYLQELSVDCKGMELQEVSIYTTDGAAVYSSKQIQPGKTAMRTGHLCAGIYLVRIVSEKGSFSKKIMVE